MAKKRLIESTDIARSNAITKSVNTTAVELLPTRLGRTRRTQFIVTNSSATTLTLSKGETVTAGQGLVLYQNQTYIESDDAGFDCWQGAVYAVASAATTAVAVEVFDL